MNNRGICPVCEQLVDAKPLVFADDCNVITDDSLPDSERLLLTVRHPAVPGYGATAIVSEQTGEVLETMCKGSWRPVKKIVIQ